MKKYNPEQRFELLGEKLLPELDSRLIRRDPMKAEDRLNSFSLSDQVRAVLQRSGNERLELILLSRKARALVQRMPDMEWYLTIKQVGDDDSMPLLALANPAKLTFLFDIEWWYRDVLDPILVIHWLNLLMECGQEKVSQWLKKLDPEMLLLVLCKFMRVFKADPQEEGNEPWRVLPLFTLDNSYYLHFLDQNLSGVLERFIKMLREAEGDYYYQVLDDLSCAIPGEVEEAAGGFRQRRMDEYGFPGFEEAFQIYAYISPEQTRGLIEESKRGAPGDRWSPPRYPLSLPDIPRLTSLALERIEGQDVIESIQFDLARLSNKVLVADALDLTKIENIDKSVRKVLGYIETGLEVLAEADPQRAAGLLSEKPLQIIFQAGYSQALRLRFRAMRLMREGWPRQVENPLSLMGEHDGPLIEALLKPRPLYYPEPGEKGETEFREFQSLSEIRRAEAALDRAGIIEPLFMDALGFNPGDMENIRAQTAGRITWESMLCTAFLKTLVSGLFSFHPISSEEIEKFLKEMMTASIPRRIKNDLRTDFINWLARRTENLGQATQAAIQDFARTSLENMEKELERMSPQNLDPRFIQTLFMKIESRVRSSVFS